MISSPEVIPNPSLALTSGAIALGVGIAGAAAGFAGVLLTTDATAATRLLVSTGILAAVVLAYFVWLTIRRLVAVTRRSLAYPKMVAALNDEREERIKLEAIVALAAGVTPATGVQFVAHGNSIRMRVPVGRRTGIAASDILLVVDMLGVKVLARATVDEIGAQHCDASFISFDDPVFSGYIRDQIGKFERNLPEGIAVLHERSVRQRIDGMVAKLLQQREEQHA